MNSQTFADYILSEHDWIKKMEIMYYLNKRGNIFLIIQLCLKLNY